MQKTKIALIGTGYIADYHARGLQLLPNVELTVAVAARLESAQKFAAKYGIKEASNDALSLVSRDDLDAVVISTPNKFHSPYAEEFLKNGKDIFLEKPMALNAKEGNVLTEVAKATNRLVLVGHMWRFDEETNYLKSVIDSGKLGKIVKTKGYGIHENWGPEGWFTRKELAGGGALIDMGVHAIDTVSYLLGDPKPTQVYARIGTEYGDYDVDDSGVLVITWETGTTSIIESGWWQPFMDGPEAATRLFGTGGYASLFPTKIRYKGKDAWEEIDNMWRPKADHCDQRIYSEQMKYFVECIRERRNPSPGLAEGQVVMDIVEAAYRSSEAGEVVNL